MTKLKVLVLILVSCLTFGCGSSGGGDKKDDVVYVYSWGDYLDPEVLKIFEKETALTSSIPTRACSRVWRRAQFTTTLSVRPIT